MATDGRIRIVSLDCWHANELIYQAEGRTDDGRCVYVRYRSPFFCLGVGDTPDLAAYDDVLLTDAYPDEDPSRITLATLREWAPQFDWPDRIDGFSNEPGG